MTVLSKITRRVLHARSASTRLLFSTISLSLICPTITEAQSQVMLKNSQWTVTINPSTLAINATPAHKSTSLLNKGVEKEVVSDLLQPKPNSVSWKWNSLTITTSAQLVQNDLTLSFNAKKPQPFTWMQQPTNKLRQGMMWPLGDGSYVPSNSKLFNQYLASAYVGTLQNV